MRSKSSFNKCNDLDLNEIKSNQWQDKETDSLTASVKTIYIYICVCLCVSVCVCVCLCVSVCVCMCECYRLHIAVVDMLSLGSNDFLCIHRFQVSTQRTTLFVLCIVSVCQFVCLTVCVSVCLFDCLCVSLSVCLFECLSVCHSVCMNVCVSVCLFECLSVCSLSV